MKLLLYCTKGRVGLYDNRKKITGALENFFLDKLGYDKPPLLNGKIVAECDFEVEELELKIIIAGLYYCGKTVNGWDGSLCAESQLDNWQLLDYLGDKIGNKGYAIHIKNLHIFDEPRVLNFYMNKDCKKFINKAPQNMQVVRNGMYNNNDEYILISIRPEWLCKILNGEKTIEVRKKVLKEML